MIRMSKLADYAFIILIHMVSESKDCWAASEIAEKTTLPVPTVAKLMKLLAKGSLVSARRGAQGGYSIAKSANNISIASIIEAVDGPIAIADCVEKGATNCAVKTFCPMHGGWNKVNATLKASLETVFLSDLLNAKDGEHQEPQSAMIGA